MLKIKSRYQKVIKNVSINLVVTFLLIFMINVVSGLVLYLFPKTNDKAMLYELPIFKKKHVVKGFYKEYGQLDINFHSFAGWSLSSFNGQYINIGKNGERIHKHHIASGEKSKRIGFFGGSTAWGMGSVDNETIPAFLDSMNTNAIFENYGEFGFNSRQGLSKLINLYKLGITFDYVIFYDGVNELALCRNELNEYDHLRSFEYKNKIDAPQNPNSWQSLIYAAKYVFFTKSLQLIEKVKGSIAPKEDKDFVNLFNCNTDESKANTIATSLMENWVIAKKLVEGNGGKFIAILQPNAFIGAPNLSHLENTGLLENYLSPQFEIVYPKIQRLIEDRSYPWIHDLSNVLDSSDMVYFDHCHIVGKGNEIVATSIDMIFKEE